MGEMGIKVRVTKYPSNGALVQAFRNLRGPPFVTAPVSALSRLLPGFLSFVSASSMLARAHAGLDSSSFS